MFGYINVTKDLADGQRGLWQTFMCGLCVSTKKLFGNMPRMLVSNDINFFNVFFHSTLQLDVEIEHKRCVSHFVTKRPIIKMTQLTDNLAVANVILNYLNLYDDVVDGGSAKKKSALKMYRKAYKKAQSLWPELDATICKRYEELRTLEKGSCNSLDQVAHSFATLSQDFCKMVLGDKTSNDAETLCYNLGKWVYLVDALDDAKKDIQKHNYNPFVACYGVATVQQLAAYYNEISFEMYAVLNRVAQCFNDMNMTKYHCILKNILLESIRQKTQQVLSKLKPSENRNGL